MEVSFITAQDRGQSTLELLDKLKDQLIWLNLSHANVTDSGLRWIEGCYQLAHLELDHTSITDKGLAYIKGLTQLQSLNLVGDSVTAIGIRQLKGLKKLRKLYLYQTYVDRRDWPLLRAELPHVELDSGGYQVPFLPTDTQIVRPPKPPTG